MQKQSFKQISIVTPTFKETDHSDFANGPGV